MSHTDIVFGPVPSRRLGRSLGINHIPPKHCSYSCCYCQVGPTPQPEIVRHAFHPPEVVCRAVAERLDVLRARGEAVDYLTCVPDGEPTLDIHLGELIDGLRRIRNPTSFQGMWLMPGAAVNRRFRMGKVSEVVEILSLRAPAPPVRPNRSRWRRLSGLQARVTP